MTIQQILIETWKALKIDANEAVRRGAQVARREAPFKTGKLRSGIRKRGLSIISTAPHSIYQDKGTRFIRAKNFMRKGQDEAIRYLRSKGYK